MLSRFKCELLQKNTFRSGSISSRLLFNCADKASQFLEITTKKIFEKISYIILIFLIVF